MKARQYSDEELSEVLANVESDVRIVTKNEAGYKVTYDDLGYLISIRNLLLELRERRAMAADPAKKG